VRRLDTIMQRINNLFFRFVTFENLLLAWRKARKGSGISEEIATFFFHLEANLLNLQDELIEAIYIPEPYRYFTIYEPKERQISVATFRDRVVHHALINILEPIYEKIFITDSFATRKEKGTHKAVRQAQIYCRQNRYYLKTDIKKYFHNIVHQILIEIIESKIKDKALLLLIEKIISAGGENGIGLPIGNLTSQFFANVYLHKFDFYVKRELKIKHYIRYMDDFVMFSNNINQLKECLTKIEKYLSENLNLSLKKSATYINQTYQGLSFLGCRTFPKTIRIRTGNLKRYIQKIKQLKYMFENNKITEDKYIESMNSYFALLSAYDTFHLRTSYPFTKVMETAKG